MSSPISSPMPRSALLACWGTAWLRGSVSFDHAVDAVTAADGAHSVAGMPSNVTALRTDEPAPAAWSASLFTDAQASLATSSLESPAVLDSPQTLGAALVAWRALTDRIHLLLPVAGDVRGLPGPAPFVAAALEAGEAVFGGALGLVPTVERSVSSAPARVTWQAFVVAAPPADPLSLAEAEHALKAAMRETATLFGEAGLGGTRARVSEELSRARRIGEELDLPPDFEPRAVALVAQAERLGAMLAIAARDVDGGAVSRDGLQRRSDALRELATTVRRARLVAYNCG